jgi:hypothetical protein
MSSLPTQSISVGKNTQRSTQPDDIEDERPDDMSKKISQQIDDEERLWDIFSEMKSFVEYEKVPLLQKLDVEQLSDFISPLRVRVF